jgi:AraC family transcriptional regulator
MNQNKDDNFYHQRLNLAIDYMNNHLDEKIPMSKLARISCFSSFHFQRIYKALKNETPYETLLRLRLEKAAFLLKNNPHVNITQVSLDCGFGSVENFSRQFKSRYLISPKEFKKNKTHQNSKIYQENQDQGFYTGRNLERLYSDEDFEVQILSQEAIPVAFIRSIFGADGSGLIESYHELMTWAETQGLDTSGPSHRFGMSVDDPEITPANKYRYDFAIRNDDGLRTSGMIESGMIPKSLYASLHCQGDLTKVGQCWDYLFKQWLPQSDFVPRHFPCVEEFIQGPEDIGWERFNIFCKIPIIKRSEL